MIWIVNRPRRYTKRTIDQADLIQMERFMNMYVCHKHIFCLRQIVDIKIGNLNWNEMEIKAKAYLRNYIYHLFNVISARWVILLFIEYHITSIFTRRWLESSDRISLLKNGISDLVWNDMILIYSDDGP